METLTRIDYEGPGWYAGAKSGDYVNYALVADKDATNHEASQAARFAGKGTPYYVYGKDDARASFDEFVEW